MQTSFGQTGVPNLDTPLHQVAFVVLDLETTGLSPATDQITEVGAVKVRGGEVLGELHCLVSPGVPIPGEVSALTGITDAMVADRPTLEAVLPTLLEFVAGTSIVGHNVRFDLGFLRAALERHHYPRLRLPVVDTARLARRVLADDEVHDCRLATLAQHLQARVTPNHRALTDARATVDVLHALLERVGSVGVLTLEDLRDYCTSRSDPAFRKRRLVRDAPEAPGVYRFLDAQGAVLYVGKARNLRVRLRRYFGMDPRRRIADLVRETTRVEWDTTPTEVEAQVRVLRGIHLHRPRYNRRSRTPAPAVYVRLTRERFPRLSIARAPAPGAAQLGPVGSRSSAEQFLEAVHDVIRLRQCTQRLVPDPCQPACLLKDLRRCGAPCDGSQGQGEYAQVVREFHSAVLEDPGRLLARLRARMVAYAAQGRFEQVRAVRQRLRHAASVLAASRRVNALVSAGELVACRREARHVDVVVVRAGRLVASARLDPVPPEAHLDEAVLETAGRLAPLGHAGKGQGALPVSGPPRPEDAEEVGLLAAWLARPGVRLVRARGTYAEPVAGGAALHATLDEARQVCRHVHRAPGGLAYAQ